MKVIFIPVSNRPECALALHHGFMLGQQTQSSVIGCHIRPHTDSDINLPSESSGSIIQLDSYDLAWEAALLENHVDDGHVKAKLLFEKMAAQYQFDVLKKPKGGACAMWMEKVGSPERLFSITGPVSDLLVVSRPAKPGKSLSRTIMMSAVLHGSSPVLVLPQHEVPPPGKRICIAWNQSPEAALAVKAAMPLLCKADQVSMVTCDPESRLGPKSKHLKRYLEHWNVKAKHVPVNGLGDNQAILEGYKQTGADLLVMGGYSRSRIRERVFGGVTEYMLNEAQIPIFVLHT